MPRRDPVDSLQMNEEGILSCKAQAVGETEERVFDNDNWRADTKRKRSKEPPETPMMTKESSLSKLMGKPGPMVKDPAAGKVIEYSKMPPAKGVPPEVSSKVTEAPSRLAPNVTDVSPRMSPMTSPMAAESPPVFYRRNDHKESRYTDNDKLFHIPLPRYTKGG